jgi:hypothetical protein
MAGPDPATVEWVPIWSAVTEGPVGPAGPPGPPGLSTTVFYFKADATNTQENDPGTGKMKWNAQPQTAATMLYFDRLTDDGFDIIALLQQTTFGTHFIIQDADLSANSQTWKQLAPGVVMGGDWFEVAVEFVSQTGAGSMQNNQRIAVLLDTMIGPHAHTHDTGGDDPITALDADVLTTGLLDDARLSPNVPRLDQANVFTQPTTFDVITAAGLSTTPLDASQLMTGTVPDARLSGNVQMKPVALGDLPASVATLPVAQSDVTGLVSDLATVTSALATKAPLASPALTGVPTAPTADVGTTTAQLATTAFVSSYLAATGYVTGPVSAVVNNLAAFNAANGARIADSTIPLTAVARKDQSNVFTQDVTFQVGPTAPTAAPGTNTTQIATTAFVKTAVAAVPVGDVVGPSSAVAGNIPAFLGTTGKLLSDSGLIANQIAMLNAYNTFQGDVTVAANRFLVVSGAGGALKLNATPATTGAIRLTNATAIMARNAGNTADIELLKLDATNTVWVGGINLAALGVAAHHATHEPGGTDVILNNAWLNQANVFTANQLVTKTRPEIQLQFGSDIAKARLFVAVAGGTAYLSSNLSYDGANWMRDDTTQGGSLLFLTSGGFNFYRTAAGANPAAAMLLTLAGDTGGNVMVASRLQIGGSTASFPAWRNTGANMDCVLGDQSNWAGLTAAKFVSTGGGNTLVDLTVTGNAAIASLQVSGSLQVTGNIQSGNYLYPGAVTAPGTIQGSWYLASHSSYGLYTNTGFYSASGIWSAGHLYAGGVIYEYGRGIAQGVWTDYTPTIGGSAFYPGSTVTVYGCSYCLIGKTCILAFYMNVATQDGTTLTLSLPPGITCARTQMSTWIGNPGQGMGAIHAYPNSTVLNLYRDAWASGNWTYASWTFAGTIAFSIN